MTAPYRARKPPQARSYDYADRDAVVVWRTHDRQVADPLAKEEFMRIGCDSDLVLPEPRALWGKHVPWCHCGGGHDGHIETSADRQRGYSPVMEYVL